MIDIITVKGRKASSGIASGVLYIIDKGHGKVIRSTVYDTGEESDRYRKARDKVASELEEQYTRAKSEIGEDEAMIFEIHRMMLFDDDFDKSVVSMIMSHGLNAEYAVAATADNLSRVFADMDTDYMRARADDVKDVANRLIDSLGGHERKINIDKPSIIASEDLTPGETVSLDKKLCLGIITEKGSDNSHSAILARTIGIPSVVGAGKIDDSYNGKEAILDGDNGLLYIEPDAETERVLLERKEEEEKRKQALEAVRGKPAITKDGRRIKVYANIGDPEDVAFACESDAEGIGLFRSEFLYMKYGRLPTEEEQFKAYKYVGERMNGKEIIVRTLDAGADKKIPYINSSNEPNPALGLRAIRICLNREEMFLTQLRALYRATAYTGISIMFPMIAIPDEVIKAKMLCRIAMNQLRAEGVPFREHTKVGIMIETPSAAICSDILAKHVDFFSIGTNDLTQYTLAADREHKDLAYLTEKPSEAVLRLISTVAKNAGSAGIPVGICGELGSDTSLTDYFIKSGITELSVTPSKVLSVKAAVINSKAQSD